MIGGVVNHIETDYLVVGAGASGLAFVDELIAHDDAADVVMVDRRDGPGGHWNDAYPYVRLHQPAAFYGVNSRQLGFNRIEADGPNAGMYEQSSAGEICDYFRRVLTEKLVGSGRVRFVGMSEYAQSDGVHSITSLVTGASMTVSVRRAMVDATYQESSVPKTHQPSFNVAPDASCIPPNDLVKVSGPPAGFVVIGAGKTAMDACAWLLSHEVAPSAITWIRARDAWLINRAKTQPLEQVASIIEAVADDLEASAAAGVIDDVYRALEVSGRMLRIDQDVWPTMYRCATLSEAELEELRSITGVVRMGHVVEIRADEIVLEDGSIPTSPEHVHIDCTANGLQRRERRPVFEPGRITIQQLRTCQPTFNAAFTGFIEASRDNDDDKNYLCPPNPYPTTSVDMLRGILAQQLATNRWNEAPDVAEWMTRSRLNAVQTVNDHLGEPRMQDAIGRYLTAIEPAIENLERLLADA
jgi:hypothetical protein